MTKQEKIQEAYADHWDLVKDIVSSGNGWTKPIGYTEKDKNFYVNLLKIAKKENWDNDQGLFRPKSLHGIVTNNGWTKIESPEDLPKEAGIYLFKTKMGRNCELYHDVDVRHSATHWRPIVQISDPIY